VWIDGRPGCDYRAVTDLQFSPEGSHWACIAGGSGYCPVVVDGRTQHSFAWSEDVAFSADGKRLAYIGISPDGRYSLVVDGRTVWQGDKAASPAFSTNGRHALAVVWLRDGQHAWRDGELGPALVGVGRPLMSPDDAHFVYGASDGRPGGNYDFIMNPGPVFAADSRHLAYIARTGSREQVVIDGRAGATFDRIDPLSLTLAASGDGFAYAASRGRRWVVVDAKGPGPEIDGVQSGTPLFSPDGASLVYGAQLGDKWRLCIDRLMQPAFDDLGHFPPAYSGNGRWIYAAKENGRWFVIDGHEHGPAYDAVIGHAVIAGSEIRYLAARNGRLLSCSGRR
jgi:hypothetical protein